MNCGIERQRFDDLADVEVDVIAMQGATRTPHLELLACRRPRGRANPSADLAGLAVDRVAGRADVIDVLLDAPTDAGFADAVIAGGFVDGSSVALLRDPDGHVLVLQETANHQPAPGRAGRRVNASATCRWLPWEPFWMDAALH